MMKQTTRRQHTTRQCKPNNARNEHDASGLLQRNVYINEKPKQQVGIKQIEYKKTTMKKETTENETNMGNEHDKNSKLVLFLNGVWMGFAWENMEDGQMGPKHNSRNITCFGGICFGGSNCPGIKTHIGLPIET